MHVSGIKVVPKLIIELLLWVFCFVFKSLCQRFSESTRRTIQVGVSKVVLWSLELRSYKTTVLNKLI